MSLTGMMLNRRKEAAAPEARYSLTSRWMVPLILAVAVVPRVIGLADWSLWFDEETSIYFSQHPDKPFPRFFPLFFLALHELYRLTGVSVFAGRALAAAFGIGGLALVYALSRRLSRAIALLAVLFLSINMGHVFWCQSIRYFTLLLVFELLSMYWFLDGFERGNHLLLLLSNVAFALALWTHFTAVLLMPVYVAYLFFMICGRQSGGAYNLRGYLFFGIGHAIVLGLMVLQFIRFHAVLKSMDSAALQDPIHLLLKVAFYFGGPVIALGFFAPWAAVNVPKRVALFFTTAGLLPVVEIAVIAQLKLGNVTWYYILIALVGLAMASAITLVSLYQRGFRWSTGIGLAVVLFYYLPLLAGYFTTMHGDRPRWKEACDYLRQTQNLDVGSSSNTQVFATSPGVVAFYLGVPPDQTMDSSEVQLVPKHLPVADLNRDQWYLAESDELTPEVDTWLKKRCTLKAVFAAWTGPKDRSVRVYYHSAGLPADRAVHAEERPPKSPRGN